MKKFFAICVVLFFTSALEAQWLGSLKEETALRTDRPGQYLNWFYGQRTFGLGYIPKDARMNALKQKESLRSKYFSQGKQQAQGSVQLTPLASGEWTPIGPINIEAGSFAHSGRIRTIATHPTDPLTAYAASAMGGVWKTINGGKKWAPLSDNAYSLAFGAIAIDPKNPNVLYGGTGEPTPNVDAYYGVGVLKTTNGGTSWSPSGLSEVGAFSKVIVNGQRSNTIYASGSRSGGGVYISDDAGATWRKASGGLPPADVTDLVYVQDGARDVLYAGLPSHGTYRSLDGGSSWTHIHSYTAMRRILLAVDPKNWKDVVNMSVMTDGSFEGMSRTTDGGENWDPIDADIQTIQGGLFGSNNQGWYDAYVERDPTNPDRIFAAGISIWRSEDAGSSWTDVGRAYQGGIHPDQHCAAFGAGTNPIFYFGCDGGIVVSDDNGETFSKYQDDLAITQFYGMAIDQNADDITYGGTQDNGTLGGGRTADWNTISGGDGGTVVVDDDNSQRLFYHRPGDGSYPIKVENGNETQLSNGIPSTDTAGWVTPLVMDQGKNILYTGRHFFYSATNRGANSWRKSTLKLDTTGVIYSIDPFGDSATIVVGTTGGKVLYSTNHGTSFQNRTAGLPGRSVTAVRFSPADKNTIYAALSGFGASHVFKSTDKGVTWVDISSTLPDIPCNALVIDPQKPTNLYVATDIGVFFSPNDGGDWIPFGTGLPNVVVADIAIHRAKRVLRAGTHGRSMYEIALPPKVAGITSPTIVTKWFIGSPTSISWYGTIATTSKVELSLDGGSNWQTLDANASGNSISIAAVNYSKTDNALVKVTSGSEILLSQSFRIMQTQAGATTNVVSEQPLYMYDIAYEPTENVLWTTNFSPTDTKIYKIDPSTGMVVGNINLGVGRENLTGIKWDALDNVFYVHQSMGTDGPSFIYKVSKTGAIIKKWDSPCVYGTGIYPKGDTLFLADRNNNKIFRAVKSDPTSTFDDIILDRKASFGPRCITYNPVSGELLHSWTDFQGDQTNAQLYDSYLLHLDYNTGAEISSTFVQEGGNAGTNCRGLEYDPNSNGKSVWMTVLNSGNSSKIIKVTLTDGPLASVRSEKTYVNYFQESYPNPFTSVTTLQYELPQSGRVKIIVRDQLGRMISSTQEQFTDAGPHSFSLDLSQSVSGAYIAELFIDGVRSGSLKLLKQ